MPKITRSPQRRTFSAWSSSSDDDASLVPSSRPMPSTRQRYYGKRRPAKKPRRNTSLEVPIQRPLPPSSKSASKHPTDTRTSKSSSRRSIVIGTNNDDNVSSSDKRLETHNNPTVSMAEEYPAMSSKLSRSRKIVVEDFDDSSSSSDDESDDTHNKPPAVSRASSKNRHKCTLDRLASSFPEFTPIVPKKARVNLTPNRSDMPKGWLTKSQLLDIASHHNGMAIQYRVMYHTSQKPIRDHNAGAARKIHYKDVVVQSRFACVSGSHGGSTYSFMHWKLPGTLLQSRKAKHITIYQDTRPRLYQHGHTETSHPLIVLCSELKGADRRMAERFLRDAKAGMTPEQFYSQKQTSASPNQEEATRNETEPMNVEQESEEDSPLVSQDEDFDDNEAISGYEAEVEVQQTSSTAMPKNSRGERPTTKARQRGSQTFLPSTKSSSSKRTCDNEAEGKTAKRARKKDYGGSHNRRREKVAFRVGASDSSVPQFLALVEGVTGSKTASRGPEDAAEDYIRDIFMNGRVEKLPTSGRMLELPGEAKLGTWTAELVDTKDRSSFSGRGMLRDKLENLKDTRIQLRHNSAKTMGPLKLSQSSSLSSPQSPDLEYRIRGGGGRSLRVSLINPLHSRRHDMLSQGIVCNDAFTKHTELCVGTISIVGFAGFSSSTDARLSAGKMSTSLLDSCRKCAIKLDAKKLNNRGQLENLLPIPVIGSAGSEGGHNVGATFICKIAMDDSYAVLLAHNDDGLIVAVDVFFDKSMGENRESLSSTSSFHNVPNRLTEEMLQRHSKKLELASLEIAVDASSENSEDDVEMIADEDSDRRSLPSSPSSAHSVTEQPGPVKKSMEESQVQNRTNAGIMIDPTPSTNKSRAASFTTVPKSILRKKSNYVHEVMPAAVSIPRETKQQSEGSSNTGEVIDSPLTTRLPFVTPTPMRKREDRDGFLAKLNQVADGELDSHVGSGSVDLHEEDDEHIFEDPLNDERVIFHTDSGGNQTDFSHGSLVAVSPVSRWPSIHDVFYGIHDEEDCVDCSSEEMREISESKKAGSMFPILVAFQEHFFGLEEDCDVDNIQANVEKTSTRPKPLRGSSFPIVRLFVATFLLWQASLLPNADNGIPLVISSRRSMRGRRNATPPFSNDMYGVTAVYIAI